MPSPSLLSNAKSLIKSLLPSSIAPSGSGGYVPAKPRPSPSSRPQRQPKRVIAVSEDAVKGIPKHSRGAGVDGVRGATTVEDKPDAATIFARPWTLDLKLGGDTPPNGLAASDPLYLQSLPKIEQFRHDDFLYSVVPKPDTLQMGEVPTLRPELQRILFNPGVHMLQDPNSGHYNFSPYLQHIVQPSDFDFDRLAPYTTASRDDALFQLAIKYDRKYASSTSSITSLLSKVYQCVSQGRRVNREMFSASLSNESVNFTGTARAPTSALLRYRDGVYLVDKESPLEDEEDTNVLMELGKSMEKMLTTSEREFATYLKSNKNAPNTPPPPEAYNYAKVESFLLRSQLDCAHKKLPKQTFDLKTRATLPIRMDTKNYANNVDYKLRKLWGLHESYERERYDMVRSTLIKYNFQVRIGNMDGILIAYHNTRQIFGFEYLSLKAMDEMLFGSHRYGNAGFAYSVKVLGRILDWVTAHYWGKDIRLTVKANVDEVGCRGKRNYLEVYAELLSENGKENENKKTKRSIKRFEFEVSSNKDNMGDYSSDDVTDWWVETTMSSVASYDPPATNSSTRKPARSQLPVSVAPGGDVDGYDNADEIDDTFFGVKRGNIVGAKLWKEYQAVRAACPNLNVGGSGNEAYVRNLRKVVAFDDEVDTRELRRIQ